MPLPPEPALIVCHCHAVSDRAIRACVRSGARSPRQVARQCDAGRSCGGCRPVIHEILSEESESLPPFSAEELRTVA